MDTLCRVCAAVLGVADLDGRLRWVNQPFVDAFGYSRQELLDLPSYLDLLHPDDLEMVLSLLADVAGNGSGPPVEVRVLCRDGSWRWYQSSTVVVDDLVYFSGVDRTMERQHADDLAHANMLLRLFSAGVAHDLRNMLTVIEGAGTQLATLDRLAPPDPEVADQLGAMLARSTDRAWIFIGALLAVTRGEAVDRAEVALSEIAEGAADDVATERKSSRALIEWPAEMPTVWVNPVLIRATLANLFVNSLRYHRDGVPPHIVVEASRTGDTVTLVVADNGRGIAPSDLEAVFEPFERRVAPPADAEAAEMHQIPSGYGLGLALCAQVVHAHGGRVWATSEPGAGTTMTIELPAVPTARRNQRQAV